MKLSAPRFVTFLIALIAGVLAILTRFINIAAIPVVGAFIVANAFWILVGAFVLMVIGCIFKGI